MIIRQKVFPNARLGDDIGIQDGSIIYEVLYFMFEVEAIVSFMAGFLVVITILIELPSRRQGIRHRCGIQRFDESFGSKIFICLGKGDANLNRHALRPNKQYWNNCPRKLKFIFLIENLDPTFIIETRTKGISITPWPSDYN